MKFIFKELCRRDTAPFVLYTFKSKHQLNCKLSFYISDFDNKYGLSDITELLGIGDRFTEVLRASHEQTEFRAVVFID